MDQLTTVIPVTTVIPAKAGIQVAWLYVNCLEAICMDSRLRGNDGDGAGMTVYQAT